MATNNAINKPLPLSISNGGTGAASFTADAVLVGSGTSPITALTVGATGEILGGITSSDPAFTNSSVGDFTFTSSTASVARTLTVSNTDNTSTSSAATLQLTTGGGNVGDPKVTYTVSGAQSYTMGIDNSDVNDSFVLAASTALGTTNVMHSDTSGNVTYPLQPAFFANGALQSNVTGNGTVYTVQFITERFDQNGDFDGTSTFTAPVDGIYLLTSCIQTGVNLTGTNTFIVAISMPSSSPSSATLVNIGNGSQFTAFGFGGAVLVQLDAADTAVVIFQVTGLASDSVDILLNVGVFGGIMIG